MAQRFAEGQLVLDASLLEEVHGSVQHILNCIPRAAKVYVDLDEIPVAKGLRIEKPVSLIAKKAATMVQCSHRSIEIRYATFSCHLWKKDACE